MKRLFLALAVLAGAAHAQPLVPIDGGWINPMTGQFYPSAGPNTAVDTGTGRTFVAPDGSRRRQAQPDPAASDCFAIKNPATDKYVMKCR
jgi:hypothetical protein